MVITCCLGCGCESSGLVFVFGGSLFAFCLLFCWFCGVVFGGLVRLFGVIVLCGVGG